MIIIRIVAWIVNVVWVLLMELVLWLIDSDRARALEASGSPQVALDRACGYPRSRVGLRDRTRAHRRSKRERRSKPLSGGDVLAIILLIAGGLGWLALLIRKVAGC